MLGPFVQEGYTHTASAVAVLKRPTWKYAVLSNHLTLSRPQTLLCT